MTLIERIDALCFDPYADVGQRTPRTAPVIDDYIEDATPEQRRVWEVAIRAVLQGPR